MAYYSYVTEACRRDANVHGMLHEVEKLAQKIEQDQTLMSMDRFPPPFLKKSLAARRVIMEERFVGNADTIVVFLAAYFRGDSDYDRFLAQDAVYIRGFRAERSPDDATLTAWLAERSEKGIEPLPEPSAIELGYLQPPAIGPQEGWMVYESRVWTDRLARPDARPWLVSLSELVQELGLVSSAPPSGLQWLQHPTQPDLHIAYQVFPHAERILLLAPVLPGESREGVALASWQTGSLADLSPEATDEALLAVSARAYPDYITLDRDVWFATQETTGRANLALSPEEASLLRGMLATTPTERRVYPLFINGRPGSGKSTILQYLFAEHLHFHLRQAPEDRTPYPPLYLTYSEPLLKRARDEVRSILRCDATKNAAGNGRIDERDLEQTTDQAFSEFRVFLRQLLPEHKRRDFDPQRFMDFLRFRQGWVPRAQRSASPAVRQITPEMAWHVVRTYIKGMRQEAAEYINPDWYAELPKKHRTVTEERFREIYKHVWDDWYRELCAKDKWWDDQDLARAVLDLESLDIARYPAIFCDEAQDFTKVELELILHLSLFHRRMVPDFHLHRVPFAFAGDPFQTLNPTGFNWEAVRASFHDNIVTQLARARDTRLEFNYQELAFNYRSNSGIVGIANLVQLIRGVVFDMPNLHPQKAWSVGASAAPVWFSTEDPDTRTGLRENPDLVILIPCQEGEEKEWVANDPILRDIALEDGQVTRYVLSPVRAKGLEFSRVVLYGFGEACAREHSMLLTLLRDEGKTIDADACLPLQYFLNRLYVAVTRAQEQLVVVDTPRGINQFWEHARHGGPETLLARYGSSAWRHEDLIRLVDGTRDAWQQHRQEPEDLAKQFLEEALAKNDSYLFTLAGANFRAAGDEPQARYCHALGLRAEGRLPEAGQALAGLGRADEALACYWMAPAWKAIVALGGETPTIRARREYDVARALDGAPNAAETLRIIELLQADVLDSPKLDRYLADGRWGEALAELVRRAAEWPKEALPDRANAVAALSRLDSLERNGFPVPSCVGLVRLAVLAGQPDRAVTTWRELANPGAEPDWLLEALCENEPYPQRLLWLHKRQRPNDIIREYEEHKAERLGESDASLVFRAYVKANRTAEAVDVVIATAMESLVSDALGAASRARDAGAEQRLAEWLLRHYVRTGRWSEAITLATQRAVQRERAGRFELSAAVRKPVLATVLVREIAGAEHLASAPDATKRQVAAFLRAHFIEGAWVDAADVTLFVAAQALERSGRFSEILPFYERLLDIGGKQQKEIVRFARERWLVNKRRQLDVLSEGSRRRAHEEVQARSHEWRMSIDGVIDPLTESSDIADVKVRNLVDGSKRGKEEPAPPPIFKKILDPKGQPTPPDFSTMGRTPLTPGVPPKPWEPATTPLGLPPVPVTATDSAAVPVVSSPPAAAAPKPVVAPSAGAPPPADGRYVSFETTIRLGDLDLDVTLEGARHRLRIVNRQTNDTVSVYRVTSAGNGHVRTTDEGLAIAPGDGDQTYAVSPWGVTVRLIESAGDVVVRVRGAKGETFLIGI